MFSGVLGFVGENLLSPCILEDTVVVVVPSVDIVAAVGTAVNEIDQV